MNNLLCHPGRIFTLDEFDGQAKAAPEAMPHKLNDFPENGKEDDMLDWCLSSCGQPSL